MTIILLPLCLTGAVCKCDDGFKIAVTRVVRPLTETHRGLTLPSGFWGRLLPHLNQDQGPVSVCVCVCVCVSLSL